MSELSEKVEQIEKQRNDLIALCSEILATITIDKNKSYFKDFPPIWNDMVRVWLESLDEIKKSTPQKFQAPINEYYLHLHQHKLSLIKENGE